MSKLYCVMALMTLAPVLAGTNVVPFGDFESGARETRPSEFWHRAGRQYLSAFPDWRLTDETAASGRWSITTASTREFAACGDGGQGPIRGSVSLRAEQANPKVRIRLSWWNRLRRADKTKEVAIGPSWQRFEIETEALQGGPMELAVANTADGARIWADSFQIDAAPPPDQIVETVVRPRPIDLSRAEAFAGSAKDSRGRVRLSVSVPAKCVELPYVSGGVPFPRGRLFRRERVRLVNGDGREIPSQVNVLSRWHADKSIKMLLVTAPTPAADADWTLEFGPDVQPMAVTQPIVTETRDGVMSIKTGRATFVFHLNEPGPRIDGTPTRGPSLVHGDGTVHEARATTHRVERRGPLSVTVSVYGEHVSETGRRCGRWVTRYRFWRASSKVHVAHCWINDERNPIMPIRSAWFDLPSLALAQSEGAATQAVLDRRFFVSRQEVVRPPAQETSEPTRHAGVFDGVLAVRDFWQNHPCAVETTEAGCRIWLWPESVKGVLIPQGFARQWEFLFDTDGRSLAQSFQTTALPVLMADPAWTCGSGVFEFLLPPDRATFPIFEQRVGHIRTLGRFAFAQKEQRNLFGVFNYGDAPGDGGWSNLESMAAHELFLHWIRTGSREHFDAARLAAEHYRDVDIHHGAGFCHTHCNNHVHSGEGWSHSWIQGVRDLYFLLGDLRALEVLQEVGERLLTKPVGWTTGRDWTRPIDNLIDIGGATGDARFLDCAKQHIVELARRQVPDHAICGAERGSWYEDRYTAGCAFTWYGCQAMAKLHQETGDDEIIDILKREIDLSLDVQTKARRSHAVLPGTRLSEDRQAFVLANPFALGRGSTLFPPLGYLADVTDDARYLRFGMKILAHYMLNLRGGSDASATSYATVFLHYAKRAGIGPKDEAAAFQRAKDFSFEQWPKGVVNGGFEADHFEGWGVKEIPGRDFYYDKLVRVGYYLDGRVRHSGRRSLRLHSDNRGRVMSVRGRFALKPRTTWRASIWIKTDPTMNPGASIALREYDRDRGRGITLRSVGEPVDGWQRRSGEFTTAVRTVATVTLSNRRGTGDAWFDDVSIEDLGRAYSLLTNNGGGREWRKPAYPGLSVDTGGSYQPDQPMSGDVKVEGRPILFAEGSLTDGVSRYNHLQKPIPSYAYWTGRSGGSITFDLVRPFRIRRVRVHVLISSRGHGTQRIELRHGETAGQLLDAVEPAANGWNDFDKLAATARRLTLVLTAEKGKTYTTLSEVEVWGDAK